MGIVNITPDSFYDGGRYISQGDAIEHAEQIIAEGADIIDLGAASTRPGAEDVGAEEELKRLLPVLDHLVKYHSNVPVSIDTFHSRVAIKTVERGASIINDISGGALDKEMYATLGKLKVPYILMHIQGTPKTMQIEPHYKNVVEEVYAYFSIRIKELRNAGVEQIIIDPGFGFGKNVEHNFSLLRHLNSFKSLGLPIMAGLSRKSMINKVLKTKPENALTGTIALNTIALLYGANILRVHDVKEAKQVIQLVDKVKNT
ncbi:MAG TPA: dihydropteroate synthase [Bacteroidia bacterium]|nr:dihydropteroate synthase [Bacteroidia bacterium]